MELEALHDQMRTLYALAQRRYISMAGRSSRWRAIVF